MKRFWQVLAIIQNSMIFSNTTGDFWLFWVSRISKNHWNLRVFLKFCQNFSKFRGKSAGNSKFYHFFKILWNFLNRKMDKIRLSSVNIRGNTVQIHQIFIQVSNPKTKRFPHKLLQHGSHNLVSLSNGKAALGGSKSVSGAS